MSEITRYVAHHAVAFAALLVAMGGSAYAAATIDSADITNNAIRSKDIRDNGVKPDDLASLESTFTVKKQSGDVNAGPNEHFDAWVDCDGGTAVGGGAATSVPDVLVMSSGPVDGDNEPAQSGEQAAGWGAQYEDVTDFSGEVTLTIWAICTE